MPEAKAQPNPQIEVIALPPLKMVLVHAKDERLNKTTLTPVIKSDEDEHVEPQA